MADSGDSPPSWMVVVGKLLGKTPRQVEWQWRRRQERRNQPANEPPPSDPGEGLTPVRCQHCNAVQSIKDLRCDRCGKRMVTRVGRAARSAMMLLPSQVTATLLIASVIVAIYLTMVIRYRGDGVTNWKIDRLIAHGALIRFEEWHLDQQWRIGTACFLHIGVLHLVMNTVSLLQVGPMVEEIFGRSRTFFLFIALGALAFVASASFGAFGVAAGASGAIMGLCGVAGGVGHRLGVGQGHRVRNHMIQWAVITVVLGFGLRADNIAHIAGFLAGLATGVLVTPRSVLRSEKSGSAAVLGVIGLLAIVALAALALNRHRMPAVFSTRNTGATGRLAVERACHVVPFDADAINAEWQRHFSGSPLSAARVKELCESIRDLRTQCLNPELDRNDPDIAQFCATPPPGLTVESPDN